MESYTDLDVHLQFICFFRNGRLYIDGCNEMQPLVMNAITGVNCIQSVFPRCKLQQSKVINKTINSTKQYRKFLIKLIKNKEK